MMIGSDQGSEGQRRTPQRAGRFLVLAVLVSMVAHAGLAVALIQERERKPNLRPIMSVELVTRAPGLRTETRVDGRSAGRATLTKATKGSSASAAATRPAKAPTKRPVKTSAKAPEKTREKTPVKRPVKVAATAPPKKAVRTPTATSDKIAAKAAGGPSRQAAKQQPVARRAASVKPAQVAAIPPAAGRKTVQRLPQKTLAAKMSKPQPLPEAVTARYRLPKRHRAKPAASRKPPDKQIALAAPTKPAATRKTPRKDSKALLRKPDVRKPDVRKSGTRKPIRSSRKRPTRTTAPIRQASLNSKRLATKAPSGRNARLHHRSQARSGAYAPPRAGRQGGINPIPRYPRIARKNGWQGRVLLAVSVGRDGRATSVRVRRSSGHAVLDRAALSTVRRWRFTPARRGAVTVAGMAVVPITFRLTR